MKPPIQFKDVTDAAKRLRNVSHATPVITSRTLNDHAGCGVFLKCENLQRGGAFKFRGATNAISRLSPTDRSRGVVAYSSGNHAQAVALAARTLGVSATVCMPTDAPRVKVEATRGYGADIVFYDRLAEDREQVARRLADERGLTLIPPYNHPHIMAGAGTAALELLEEVSGLDAVIAPVGGGGLLAGTAVAARGVAPAIRVFGVEPETADDTRRSLEAGRRIPIAPPATIADGLRITIPGDQTFPVIQRFAEGIVTVSEQEIRDSLRFAILRLKLVVEPSGAVPLAALLNRRLPGRLKRIGVIVSGGNIDPSILAQTMQEPEENRSNL